MAVVSSDAQVILKRRKYADKARVAEKEAERIARENQKKDRSIYRDKFVRAENLVARSKARFLEHKRVNKVLRHEAVAASKAKDESKLLFVIRIQPQDTALEPTAKALKVFQVLRLDEPNKGVFVKTTPAVIAVLKLVAPFIVVGQPSLAAVRELFQKRACIAAPEEGQPPIKLDNNQAVEDKFGDDLGYIVVEDLVHEICSLGDNFKAVTRWLEPFSLTAPVQGWSPVAKLDKLRYKEETKKPLTLAGHAKLDEIDIDKFIAEQN